MADSQKSNAWLYIILSVVLGLTVWTAMQDDEGNAVDIVELAVRQQQEIIPKANQPLAPLIEMTDSGESQLIREPSQRKIVNLFKATGWYTPPREKKVIASAVQSVKPSAPALPFQYNGKLEGIPGGTVVFLVQGSKLFTAKLGQVVNASWRLEAEDERALEFTYLPLGLKKTLSKSAVVHSFAQPLNQETLQTRQIIPD